MNVERFTVTDVLLPHHFYMGILLATFAFIFVWRRYPRVGATLVLLGLAIAADDAISHAFQIWTPLDWFWNRFMYDIFN